MKLQFKHPADVTTGAVLAGGKSSRMGRDKGMMKINGMTLVERTYHLLGNIFPKVIIISNRAGYYKTGAEVYKDLIPGKGPMGGIYTALYVAESPFVLAVACDMPFVNEELLHHILKYAEPKIDAVVPVYDDTPQPLCAVYQKTCLPKMEQMLRKGNFKLQYLLTILRTCYLTIDSGKQWCSPHLFLNVNTMKDYQKALSL